MNEELRLYTFTLYQLSSIQQGIQAAHATVELAMKSYQKQMTLREGTDFRKFHDWATNWKTMVCLNGGDLKELCELYEFLCDHRNTLPWAAFYEDESLGGCMTSIAMIVPARLFDVVQNLRRKINLHTLGELEPWELEFVHRMADAGKAR